MKTTELIRLSIGLTLLNVLFAAPAPVQACSCVEPSAPAEAFTNSDAVFTGKVTAVSDNSSPVIFLLDRLLARVGLSPAYLYSYRFWGYEITFAVLNSWKNVATTRVKVHTGTGGGDCGYLFNQGSDYLVYAYEWNDNENTGLGTGICTRTSEISRATEDLSYLNSIPTLPLTPVYDFSWMYCAGAALFFVIVPLLTILILVRRRQQHQPAVDNP